MVNNTPIKFIIDSGSSVTLITQHLINDTLDVEKLNTKYKDVNDNTIECFGQTKATVKTNNTTLKLLLLITKANITPLMRLDLMKRLGMALTATTDSIKIHNIKMDVTEKKILKIKSGKKKQKKDASRIQQKGRPIPIQLQVQVAKEIKRINKSGCLERATEMTEDCFVSPAELTANKDKSLKSALDSRTLHVATTERKAQMPNKEELISKTSKKHPEKRRRNLDIEARL